MAANQTENYGLSQWLATDQVVHTDFNADNAKLDAALAGKAEAGTVSALQTVVAAKAEQTALTALAATVPKLAVGSYTGNGTSARTISLGFTPKAVYVCSQEGATHTEGANLHIHLYGGLAVAGSALLDENGTSALSVVSGGFQVTTALYSHTNQSGTIYHYFALA